MFVEIRVVYFYKYIDVIISCNHFSSLEDFIFIILAFSAEYPKRIRAEVVITRRQLPCSSVIHAFIILYKQIFFLFRSIIKQKDEALIVFLIL